MAFYFRVKLGNVFISPIANVLYFRISLLFLYSINVRLPGDVTKISAGFVSRKRLSYDIYCVTRCAEGVYHYH